MPDQAIRFLSHRGSRVAYAVNGSGPLVLLDVGRAHHLEAFWRHVPYRRFVQRLARQFTVVRWDRLGFGLSDRSTVDLAPEAEMELVEGLLRSLGSDRAAIVAADDAGPIAVRFAARHPERVSRLALFGTSADGRLLGLSLPAPAVEALIRAGSSAIYAVAAAALTAGSEPVDAAWLASALEASTDLATMARLMVRLRQVDARADLPLVSAPTLVLHREGDAVVEAHLGRHLASVVPGAAFVALPGRAHLLYEGDPEPVLGALMRFFAADGAGEPGRAEAALARRELEVVRMVTLGLTNAEIGHRLGIRRRTVDAHLEHIRAKLGIRSRAGIAAWAVHNRLAVGADGRAI